MDAKLSHLVKWPDRETLLKTLTSSVRCFFKSCCVIIDCTEIFIERPSGLINRGFTCDDMCLDGNGSSENKINMAVSNHC